MPRRIVYFQNGDELEEYSTEEEEDEPDKVSVSAVRLFFKRPHSGRLIDASLKEIEYQHI